MDSFLDIHVKHVFEGFVGVVFFLLFFLQMRPKGSDEDKELKD